MSLIAELQADPETFVAGVLGIPIWSGMRMLFESVQDNQRTSCKACHGISKTITAAAIATWWFNVYPNSTVVTTAPTGRQVKELLWKEIGAFYTTRRKNRTIRLNLAGEYHLLHIRHQADHVMMGFSTDVATRIEGFHSPHILWILDEAKGLPQWVYDAVEGSLTGGHARVLEISTTDGADQQCPLRKHHTVERRQWNTISFSAFDSPFVAPEDYPQYDKHRNKELHLFGKPQEGPEWPEGWQAEIQVANNPWIDDKIDTWLKTNSYMWDTKVLGTLSEHGIDAIVPLHWVESAIDAVVPDKGEQEFGLDVSRWGDDQTVLFRRIGGKVFEPIVWEKKRTTETAGRTIKIAKEYGVNEYTQGRNGIIKVDAIGVGAGVFDTLADLGYPVIGIESAEKAHDDRTFYNLRAEMWWNARIQFERQFREGHVLSIPNDPELIEDITGLKYSIYLDGRVKVEDKEKFKARMGRSPNKGDAFVYCLYRFPRLPADEYEPAEERARRK